MLQTCKEDKVTSREKALAAGGTFWALWLTPICSAFSMMRPAFGSSLAAYRRVLAVAKSPTKNPSLQAIRLW